MAAVSQALMFSGLYPLLPHALRRYRNGGGASLRTTLTEWGMSVAVSAVLIAAGVYQLSPLKGACLSQCRNPAQFLSRNYRPGRAGAFSMGVKHGAFCVGCCWLLMALLFVGGVMNLAWIALLTLLVAAEKLLPGGRWIALVTGGMCIVWGAVTAFA